MKERLHRIVKGVKIYLTSDEEAALREEWRRNEEKTKVSYKEERLLAYPPICEQLDMIFHEGLAAWKAKIKSIKRKYPKPGDK